MGGIPCPAYHVKTWLRELPQQLFFWQTTLPLNLDGPNMLSFGTLNITSFANLPAAVCRDLDAPKNWDTKVTQF